MANSLHLRTSDNNEIMIMSTLPSILSSVNICSHPLIHSFDSYVGAVQLKQIDKQKCRNIKASSLLPLHSSDQQLNLFNVSIFLLFPPSTPSFGADRSLDLRQTQSNTVAKKGRERGRHRE